MQRQDNQRSFAWFIRAMSSVIKKERPNFRLCPADEKTFLNMHHEFFRLDPGLAEMFQILDLFSRILKLKSNRSLNARPVIQILMGCIILGDKTVSDKSVYTTDYKDAFPINNIKQMVRLLNKIEAEILIGLDYKIHFDVTTAHERLLTIFNSYISNNDLGDITTQLKLEHPVGQHEPDDSHVASFLFHLIYARNNHINAAKLDQHSNSALHFAAQFSLSQIVNYLLKDRKTKINKKNKKGKTPLHLAVEDEHAENIDALLNADADVRIPDYSGNTPLMTAFHSSTVRNNFILHILLSHYEKMNIPFSNSEIKMIRHNIKFFMDVSKKYGGTLKKIHDINAIVEKFRIPGFDHIIAQLENHLKRLKDDKLYFYLKENIIEITVLETQITHVITMLSIAEPFNDDDIKQCMATIHDVEQRINEYLGYGFLRIRERAALNAIFCDIHTEISRIQLATAHLTPQHTNSTENTSRLFSNTPKRKPVKELIEQFENFNKLNY